MGILDAVVDAAAAEPVLTAIAVVMLAFVFGAYFFVRRVIYDAKRGYEAGRRGD